MTQELPQSLPRSYLFVPGNRPNLFDKAWMSGADAVIIDLEDAVAPADKDAARATVAAWLSPAKPVVLRVNALDTPWFANDLTLSRHAGVAALMLPKAERRQVDSTRGPWAADPVDRVSPWPRQRSSDRSGAGRPAARFRGV